MNSNPLPKPPAERGVVWLNAAVSKFQQDTGLIGQPPARVHSLSLGPGVMQQLVYPAIALQDAFKLRGRAVQFGKPLEGKVDGRGICHDDAATGLGTPRQRFTGPSMRLRKGYDAC